MLCNVIFWNHIHTIKSLLISRISTYTHTHTHIHIHTHTHTHIYIYIYIYMYIYIHIYMYLLLLLLWLYSDTFPYILFLKPKELSRSEQSNSWKDIIRTKSFKRLRKKLTNCLVAVYQPPWVIQSQILFIHGFYGNSLLVPYLTKLGIICLHTVK